MDDDTDGDGDPDYLDVIRDAVNATYIAGSITKDGIITSNHIKLALKNLLDEKVQVEMKVFRISIVRCVLADLLWQTAPAQRPVL